jgi:hypothetical protein
VDGLVDRRPYLQVNRIFRDVILTSPLIQHKADLFAAGLEYNIAAGVGLHRSRASLQSTSSLNSLRPMEVSTVENPPTGYERSTVAAGGVYAIAKSSVRLFAPGSVSRGVPYKEWEIPIPILGGFKRRCYGFYPGANVIAFAETLGPS